ncbi:hypothetical protein [Streptomyces flaveus]|uniref:hypothetical protein n=1 Tax=Streptomyces flaveus TaxID=66370 RepID=UPI00331E266A
MRVRTVRGLSRLSRLLGFAAALALVGSLAAIPLGTVQKAAAASTPGWYMIVSDYYDGTDSHGDGQMRCLSTNGATSTSGSGTHSIYMAVCNPDTPGQWWRVLSTDGYNQLRNRQQWEGVNWCLSSNETTPSGGFPGSHGAYTSKCSSTNDRQKWSWYQLPDTTNTFSISTYVVPFIEPYELSTTSSSPYAGNLYKVFTMPISSAPTHNWRLYAPTAPPA